MLPSRTNACLAAALAALGALAGCILAVNDDPSKLHATCTFTGDDSPCGKCLELSCAKALDACCSDSLCSEVNLSIIGTCTPGAAECLISDSYGGADLGTCLNTSCTASCGASTLVDAGPITASGSTTCDQVEDSCFCTQGGTPNGVVCSVNNLKGPGLCCAEYGWSAGATGKSCSCLPFSCTPEGTDTLCDLATSSTLTTSASGSCCASTSTCDCSSNNDECSSPVSECTVASIGCSSGDEQVDSCSF